MPDDLAPTPALPGKTTGSDSSTSDPPAPQQPSHPTRASLGWRHLLTVLLTLFLATISILGAVAYLSFLWFSRGTGWKLIIFSNWAATSVALSAVVIRWLSGLQIILATSILALAILRAGSPLDQIPKLSTLRYNNSGPLDLLWLAERWNRAAIHLHLFILCLLAILSTLLLQFTSALLLSDLDVATV
jgi:hypothetical protein